MAGVEGVEPSHTVPETAVLPLDDTPMSCALLPHRFLGGVTLCQGANQYITDRGTLRQPPFFEKKLLILQVIYKTPGERGVGGSFMKNYRITVRSRTMKAIYPPLRG